MRVISKKVLESFWLKHPAAKAPLQSWHHVISKTSYASFSEIKKSFNSADYVAPFTIFDVGGNNVSVKTAIHYNTQIIYIRAVMTHREYDQWTEEHRKQRKK